MQNNQQSLAELEKLHKEATAEADQVFSIHGDTVELRTMRSGLAIIEEKITELRRELQIGVEEIKNEVEELRNVARVTQEHINKDVEELNTRMLDEIHEIEKEVKELRDANEQ